MRVVHLPSVRRSMCPAQVHLRRLCSRTQLMILPDAMAASMHRAVRFCHSTQPSSYSASRPPSQEFSLEMDASLDNDDDDDNDDEDDESVVAA